MAKIIEKTFFALEILSDNPDTEALCELYWEISESPIDPDWPEFANNLATISKISGVPTKKIESIVKDASILQVNLWKCKECTKPYRVASRKDIQDLSKKKMASISKSAIYLCSECGVKEAERQKLEKEKQEQEKHILIHNFFAQRGVGSVSTNNLSLRQMIDFVSVIQAGGSENLQKILPFEIWEQKLSPSKEYSMKMITTLLDDSLIRVHPETAIDSVTNIDPNSGAFSYYPDKVTWLPATSSLSPDSPNALIQEILKILASPWTDNTWADEAYGLWLEIAVEECKEFLIFQLKGHHFEFSPGDKTMDYLTYALKNFSVAQVFNLIWGSVQSGAALYQRGGISRKQAANTAVATIQSKAERYIANQWDPKPFERNYSLPESILSRLFYSVVLGLGDAGIKEKISMDTINKHLAVSSAGSSKSNGNEEH